MWSADCIFLLTWHFILCQMVMFCCRPKSFFWPHKNGWLLYNSKISKAAQLQSSLTCLIFLVFGVLWKVFFGQKESVIYVCNQLIQPSECPLKTETQMRRCSRMVALFICQTKCGQLIAFSCSPDTSLFAIWYVLLPSQIQIFLTSLKWVIAVKLINFKICSISIQSHMSHNFCICCPIDSVFGQEESGSNYFYMQLTQESMSNCSNLPQNALYRPRLRSGAVLGLLLHLFVRQNVVSWLHFLAYLKLHLLLNGNVLLPTKIIFLTSQNCFRQNVVSWLHFLAHITQSIRYLLGLYFAGMPFRLVTLPMYNVVAVAAKYATISVIGQQESVAMCKKKTPQDDPSINALKFMALAWRAMIVQK